MALLEFVLNRRSCQHDICAYTNSSVAGCTSSEDRDPAATFFFDAQLDPDLLTPE